MHILDVHPEEKREEAEKIFTDMFAGFIDYCPLPLLKKALDDAKINYEIFFNERDGDMFERLSKPFLSKYLQNTRMLTKQSVDDFWDRFLEG